MYFHIDMTLHVWTLEYSPLYAWGFLSVLQYKLYIELQTVILMPESKGLKNNMKFTVK